jgi:hypothetical protein
LRFITDSFDDRAKATQLLIAKGLTTELSNFLRNSRLDFGFHVRLAEIRGFD